MECVTTGPPPSEVPVWRVGPVDVAHRDAGAASTAGALAAATAVAAVTTAAATATVAAAVAEQQRRKLRWWRVVAWLQSAAHRQAPSCIMAHCRQAQGHLDVGSGTAASSGCGGCGGSRANAVAAAVVVAVTVGHQPVSMLRVDMAGRLCLVCGACRRHEHDRHRTRVDVRSAESIVCHT